MVACSSKRKAQCHGPACSWIVGRGCRKATLQQHIAQGVAQGIIACYKKRKAQCHGPACTWIVGRGCKKAPHHIPLAQHPAIHVPLPRTPTPSPRRSPTPIQRRASNRLYVLNNAGNRVQNMTSLDNIPKTYAIKLDTQWYDRRYLEPWIRAGHVTVPHSRRRFTIKEYTKIMGVPPRTSLGLTHTPRRRGGWFGIF